MILDIFFAGFSLLFRGDCSQPGRPETFLGRNALVRIEFQHLIQEIEGQRWHEDKLFADAAAVLLLGPERVPLRQADDIGPHGRSGRSAQAGYQFQLHHLHVGLENGFLQEKLPCRQSQFFILIITKYSNNEWNVVVKST